MTTTKALTYCCTALTTNWSSVFELCLRPIIGAELACAIAAELARLAALGLGFGAEDAIVEGVGP